MKWLWSVIVAIALALLLFWSAAPSFASRNCDPSYPDVCIAPPPPDLDCKDIDHHDFKVIPPDPHDFDRDQDGVGCESR